MTTVELTNRIELNSAAAATLNAAARFWFVVAVAGQLMFACYIALVYGGAAVQGNLQASTSRLANGYEAGNTVGNTVLFAHLLFAGAISFMGLALFVASGSLFLGTASDPVMKRSGLRATLFTPAIRATHLPEIPVLIVVVITILWLCRIVFTKRYKQPSVGSLQRGTMVQQRQARSVAA